MSVLEIVNSRKGDAVVVQDGRYLASSIDPVREAEQWLSRVAPELKRAQGRSGIILMGLGSGYQAKILSEVLGSHALIVVEPTPELIPLVRGFLPELGHVKILSGDTDAWVDDAEFRDFACARFITLKNPVSVQIHPVYFKNLERLLIGREHLEFLRQLKMRPELHAHLDPARIQSVVASMSRASDSQNTEGTLVSVKTMQSLFSNQAHITRERRLWKLLEELVV